MEYAQSYEYEYRKIWGIPRHDPSLEKMTPEEFEFEVLVDTQYMRLKKGQPLLRTDHETWREDAQKELEERIKKEQERAQANKEVELEPVSAEEVFGDR